MNLLTRNQKIAVAVSVAGFILIMFPLFIGNNSETEDVRVNEDGSEELVFNPKQAVKEADKIEGLDIEVELEGEGEVATPGSKVAVHYVLTREDKTFLESSYVRGDPFIFTLGENQVIQGWEKGVVGMREGEKRTLTIAPELAYGTDSEQHPLGGTTLVFEILMVEVVEKGVPASETEESSDEADTE